MAPIPLDIEPSLRGGGYDVHGHRATIFVSGPRMKLKRPKSISERREMRWWRRAAERRGQS
jgi:hypothetical protein